MNEKSEHSLDLIHKMENKSQLRSIPPRWFNYTISLLAGIFFALIIEIGILGLITLPVMLCLVIFHYRKAGVWPYFFKPAKKVASDIKEEFTSKIFINIILIIGMVMCPFFLIKVIEFKANGISYAPYVGAVLISAYTLLATETSRNFYLKKYSV